MIGLVVRKETARLVKVKNEWHCTLVYAFIVSTGPTVPFICIRCTRKLTLHMERTSLLLGSEGFVTGFWYHKFLFGMLLY